MRRVQRKAILKNEKPIVIKIDPTQTGGIMLPKVNYELVTKVSHEEAFNGMIIPLPRVLLYFLTNRELKVLATILEETIKDGICRFTVTELATRLKLAIPTVSSTLGSLRKMGLLLESANGQRGAGKIRKINFEAIQHLNDLVEGEDPGVYVRLRKAAKRKDINNMIKEDVELSYDNKIHAPNMDPAEDEEYD